MLSIPDIQIDQRLHQSRHSVIYRGRWRDRPDGVVVKTLSGEHPSVEAIVRFRREFEIARRLELPRVVRVHRLDKVAGLPVIVMEDGGESLDEHLRTQPLDLLTALEIGVQLAATLDQIHQRYVIHKDINPSNILWNPRDRQIKLIDFGISSELARETVAVQNPGGLEGTLRYISPEQTGRMNRALDYRSDLYSLGATLYHLLTGQPCFDSDDPMELVHLHIAQTPLPPNKANPRVPELVSDIVLKLLAKLAEDRYQSAAGVHHDLAQAQHLLQQRQACPAFALGGKDISPIFNVPQKLYGRDEEIRSLLNCFDRVSAGHREILMVRGYSGIGKSLLIHELQKPIVKQKGLFIEGKFDQFKRNIPYASLIQAFQELVRQLLSGTDDEVARWQQSLLAELGPNGQVIVEVIPDLELLIGPQPSVPDLPPAEANNRFKLTFRNFVRTFANEQHPLVVFLDDLQWADVPSLQLIENLLGNRTDRHLLIIGAYRDNEVDLVHPLTGTLQQLADSGVQIRALDLAPLRIEHVEELVADTLRVGRDDVRELAQLCWHKTQGNPFFLSQFLRSLYEHEIITFDPGAACWRWRLDRAAGLQVTDNVVHLVVSRLRTLDATTQTILQFAACIGATFPLRLLSVATQLPPGEVNQALWPALQAGLVLPVNDAYKFVQIESDEAAGAAPQFASTSAYRFLHDRVQQAAYSLIEPDSRSELHLRTGRLLLQSASEAQKEEQIFDIVGHLNRGHELIISAPERRQLATLNLRAADKALASSAYGPAFSFASTGLALLPEDGWASDYELSFALHFSALQSAFLTGEYESMERWASLLLAKSTHILEQVRVYEVKIQAAMALNQPLMAIEVALQALALLGVEFPEALTPDIVQAELAASMQEFARLDVDALLDMPEMTDPVDVAAMQLMNRIYSATYIAKPELMVLVSCRLALLSLRKGITPLSSFAYSAYGLVLCGLVGDIDRGHRFGALALRVYDRYHLRQHKCRTYFMVNNFVWHWKRPIKETLKPLLESYQSGLDTGELEFAGYAAYIYTDYCLFAGKPLDDLSEETRQFVSAIDRIGQQTPLFYALIVGQTIANLQAEGWASPGLLRGAIYDESSMIEVHRAANDQAALAFLGVHKLWLSYLFGDLQTALACAIETQAHTGAITGMFHDSVFHFFAALTLCAAWPAADDPQRAQLEPRLWQHREQLRRWAEHCPLNHRHRHLLVEAEWHHLQGRETQAREAFKESIQLAQRHEFVHDEALGFERLAHFWNDLQEPEIGLLYARHAHHRYRLWGAHAKAAQLEQGLLAHAQGSAGRSGGTHAATTITSRSTHSHSIQDAPDGALDALSVMKASQAVADEIKLDALLDKIMAIVIENAGAQRGALFLRRESHWQLVADSRLGQSTSALVQPVALNSAEIQHRVPRAVIEYVARTRDHVVLANACEGEVFADGAYIAEHRIGALLCMPIIYQHRLNGILYLENNLTPGAFTQQRVEILGLLSAWMSISIENAQLYQAQQALNDNLEALVEQRTAELSTALLDLDRQKQQMYELAMRDQLTSLYNRHYLLEIAGKAIKQSDRHGVPLSLIVVDVDHFKHLNDTYGHPVGDRVLAQVGALLNSSMRASDVAARFGGEEFVLLLPNCDLPEAVTKAEELRTRLQQLQPDGRSITASFGVSATRAGAADNSFDTLLRRADQAMYEAKLAGRNRVMAAPGAGP